MENVKQIIAKNLVELRKQNKLTQLELAERLNYSDKAVSRWERGDTLPDIDVLCKICDMYGVTFDYLTHEGDRKEKEAFTRPQDRGNKIVITLLAETVIWFFAVLLFFYFKVFDEKAVWQVFLWAVPASALVAMVFNCIWGKRGWTLILISVMIWSLLAALFIHLLTMAEKNVWPVFLLGAPLQVAIFLWANLGRVRPVRSKKEKKTKPASREEPSEKE